MRDWRCRFSYNPLKHDIENMSHITVQQIIILRVLLSIIKKPKHFSSHLFYLLVTSEVLLNTMMWLKKFRGQKKIVQELSDPLKKVCWNEMTCFSHSSFDVSYTTSWVSCITRKCIWSLWYWSWVSNIVAGVLPAGICKKQFFCLSHLSEFHTISWGKKKLKIMVCQNYS